MALLVLKDLDGKPILVHSSQIGFAPKPLKPRGDWPSVWRNFDKDRR